jgi:transcriptional repressor NF-X1
MSSAQQETRPAQNPSNRGNNRRGRGRRPNPTGRTTANATEDHRPQFAGESSDPHEQANKQQAPQSQSSRARRFGGQLSTPAATGSSVSKNEPTNQPKSSHVREIAPHTRLEGISIPDLTAKLMDTLKAPPYAECVICFAPIIPQQPIWTCTVSEETNRCCWGVFHNKCIVAWSKKSEFRIMFQRSILTLKIGMQETKAAFQARNEDRDGEWRCPGCQTVRTMAPGQYKLANTTS